MIKKLIKIATKAEVTGQFFMMYLNERKQAWLLYAIAYKFFKIKIFSNESFKQEEKYHAIDVNYQRITLRRMENMTFTIYSHMN